MKTFTNIFTMIFALTMAVIISNAQSQIQFEGLYSQGEGGAAWNADGSGPEPYGNGHGSVYYYISSRDYVDPTSSAGAHMLANMPGFPLFEQALNDNGFTPEQVKMKIALASMGEDREGIDWFSIGSMHYANFFPAIVTLELAGEPLFEAIGNYCVYIVGQGPQRFETGYLKINNISANSSNPVKLVAAAFMADLETEELMFEMQVNYAATLSGNGRTGSYYDVSLRLEKGLPAFPLQGLHADNEGAAAWNADGTGTEPYGNGHLSTYYYCASVDYGDINPHPDAALAHFLEGSAGFLNTLIQLQYRGFEIGDLKIKMGLASLGPDVEGEDWGYENGRHWVHEYNNAFTIEIDGEPIIYLMQDTMKMVYYDSYWRVNTSLGKAYDISQNASANARFVAQSFLRDLGTHFIKFDIPDMHSAGSFSGNGRTGSYYQFNAATLTGVHERATFIPAGNVRGTWTAENSPYYVDGHLEIENGDILTIEPGVKVAVRGPFHFNVQGCIKAEGTAEEKILFTRSNPNLWWDGFDYVETSNSNETSVFDHCIFEYGYAQGGENGLNSGGAFAVKYFDNIEIKNSLFRYNFCDRPGYYPPSGGAIGLWNADILIQSCVFHDNYSGYGGAVFSYSHADPVISNCLFYDNHADFGGALCYWSQSSGKLINNTIVDNMALDGGGLYFYLFSNPEIINNIIWGNTASGYGNQAYFAENNIPGFYYNTIQEGSSGFGGNFIGHYLFNIEDDPAFETSPELPPYMISSESPCMDAGTPDTSAWYYPQYLPEKCLCGNPRIDGPCIDMGAYEQLSVGIPQVDISGKIALKVSPNPFNTVLNIDFSTDHQAVVTIEVFNAMGKKVDQIANSGFSAGDHILSWQNPALPKGLYFIRLKTDTGSFTQKVVKY